MLDIEVVKLLSDKERYEKYIKLINRNALSEEANNIVKALGKWHSEAVSSFSWSKFAAWFGLVLHSKMDAAKMGVYKEMFKRLDEDPTFDPAECAELVESLIKRDYATKAAEFSLAVADGAPKDLSDLDTITADYRRAVGKLDAMESHVVSTDVSKLVGKLKESGLEWRLDCLNEALGPIHKGDFVVFSTRPDTGKTTMLASEATHMATQMAKEKVVLWINNEEDGSKVFARVLTSALAITTDELEEDAAKVAADYEKMMGRMDKVVIYDKADCSTRDVELLLQKYDVGLVVIDQLYKIHGFTEEAGSEVTRQGMLFGWAREICKKYAPVLVVHQADGSAEGARWINMAQLYGSKTVIQGEADAIVTIGRDATTGDTRYLYVPKNKLRPRNKAMRNGKWEIQILPEIGRYKEF